MLGGLRTHALEFGRHLRRGLPLRGRFGFDACDVRCALLRRLRLDALDLGSHLRGDFTLRRRFGFHAREFRRALFGGLRTNALDFGRHPGIGLRLDQRDFGRVNLGVDGVLGRPARRRARAKSSIEMWRSESCSSSVRRLVAQAGFLRRLDESRGRRDLEGDRIDGEILEHRIERAGCFYRIVVDETRSPGGGANSSVPGEARSRVLMPAKQLELHRIDVVRAPRARPTVRDGADRGYSRGRH